MTRKSVWIYLLSLTVLVSCTSDPLDVDASAVKVDISFVDVNEVIMNADSVELISKHRSFEKGITNIYAYLVGYCMEIGDVEDTAFYNSVMTFRKDETIAELDGHIEKEFKDKSEIEANVTNGFKHLKYHLTDCKLPKNIVYMNTLFRSGVFCTEEEISIGMQQYLGADNPVVQKLDPQYYYDWMKKGFDKTYLERDVLTGWIETHLVEETDGNLAEQVIRWGKILYLTEAAFPEMEDHKVLRYTKENLDWALDNEYAFWKYLVDEGLLFKIDDRMTRNMIGDGPFTPGLPEEGSPDRMGQFLGWRMIHMYVEKNDVSIEELLKLPYNDILQEYEIE